jgi:2-acylglycerol O-acyltransferase 2
MATLNAEPTLPEDRENQQLPPKSYADALGEDAPAEGAWITGKKTANGAKAVNGSNHVGSDGVNKAHQASVLRIVDTNAPAAEDAKEDRPQYERRESKYEYSATV